MALLDGCTFDVPGLMRSAFLLRDRVLAGDDVPAIMKDMHDLKLAAALAMGWLRNGFPSVEMSHRLAAALACTECPASIRWPWTSFLIYLPSLFAMPLSFADPTSRGTISHALIHNMSDDERFGVLLVSSSGSAVNFVPTWDEVFAFDRDGGAVPPCWFGKRDDYAKNANVRRGLRCVFRLIGNACVAMSEPKYVCRIGKGNAAMPFARDDRRVASASKTQLFRLGMPVKIDCREAVRDYIEGAKRTLAAVRWLVRGHWTHQAYGPGKTLRRLQWIEPYWKGADDLPINVRAHQLGDVTP